MGAKGKRRWKLGGRVTEAGRHSCSFVKDLSEAEVKELKVKFRSINDLADQDGFVRVLESGNRWGELVKKAEAELAGDGRISSQTQLAAGLELSAFIRLFERLIDKLGSDVAELAAQELTQREAFARAIDRVNRTGPYALLRDAGRESNLDGALLRVRKTLDPLYVRGFETYGAHDLVVTAVASLTHVLVPYFLACEPEFQLLDRELRQLTDAVPAGLPSVVSFLETEDGGDSGQFELTDLPVFSLASLERIFAALHDENAEGAILQLIRGRSRRKLRFGEASADSAAIGGTSSEGLDALPTASLKLDIDLLGSEPIDYWAPMSDTIEEGGHGREMFLGAVQKATPNGRMVTLECEGATALTEQVAGGLIAANMKPGELIRAMIARSGWEGELNLSEEPTEPETEVFEVLVPLHGVDTEETALVGAASILPRAAGLDKLATLDRDEAGETGLEMIAEFEEASSYLQATPSADLVNEAEDVGLVAIDTALAWLTTRGRYGAATLPGGDPQRFDRQLGLRPPSRGAVVLVLGTVSRRMWLRRPAPPQEALVRHLSDAHSSATPVLPVDLDVNDRLALLALQLAASEVDPLIQVQALWQAIESYAERRKGERRLFNKREKAELRTLIPEGLSPRQQARLEEAIASLNHEPLALRLQRRLKRDAVLITEAELSLLDDLREVRNDVVHGRPVERPPQRDEINYGISIVARMLVHRVAAIGVDSP